MMCKNSLYVTSFQYFAVLIKAQAALQNIANKTYE